MEGLRFGAVAREEQGREGRVNDVVVLVGFDGGGISLVLSFAD